MVSVYNIWAYFTDAEQEEACRAAYTETPLLYGGEVFAPRVRTRGNECPLGVAMRHRDGGAVRCPRVKEVTDWLEYQERIPKGVAIYHVYTEAAKFINDWDDGKIDNLWESMSHSYRVTWEDAKEETHEVFFADRKEADMYARKLSKPGKGNRAVYLLLG